MPLYLRARNSIGTLGINRMCRWCLDDGVIEFQQDEISFGTVKWLDRHSMIRIEYQAESNGFSKRKQFLKLLKN